MQEQGHKKNNQYGQMVEKTARHLWRADELQRMNEELTEANRQVALLMPRTPKPEGTHVNSSQSSTEAKTRATNESNHPVW